MAHSASMSSRQASADADSSTHHPTLIESLKEYARGIAGGLLFSLPLLYTMEIWWAGFIAGPWRLCILFGVTFALLLGYNRFVGLHNDATLLEIAVDSIEEMGIGLLLSMAILWMLGRITPRMPLQEIVGKTVVEAMNVAIGVSVGTAQLGGQSHHEGQQQDNAGSLSDNKALFAQLVLALCGAVLIAANVAPTEEIVLIAVESNAWHLLMMSGVSLVLSAMILFYSDFTGAPKRDPDSGFSTVLRGTAITYGIALLASAAILWFFGRFTGTAFGVALAETIVLGVPAVLGASAGRLLLQ